jgi:hypothetical protein
LKFSHHADNYLDFLSYFLENFDDLFFTKLIH